MKILKTASGKRKIKISKREWLSIGEKAGWMKFAQVIDDNAKQNIANTAAGAVAKFISQFPRSQDGGRYELETVEETLSSLLPINRDVVRSLMNRLSSSISNVVFGKVDISSLQGLATPQGILAILNELSPSQQPQAIAP